MKPKVFIAVSVPPEIEKYIAKHCDYRKWEGEGTIPQDELLKEVSNVEGLLIQGIKIDKKLLDHAPNLKIVSNVSVGYNNFDIEAMRDRGVIGTHTPYVLDDTVADLVFGLILSTARRIPELDQYVKQGKWKKSDETNLYGTDIHHSTLGLIGMGRIGEAIAKRGKFGFDMDVLYYNRTPKPKAEKELGVSYTHFKELLQKSDVIVLMTPLTSETANLIGANEFKLMKKTAFFINTSRGQTVDEGALLEALQTKEILGAGLDVYQQEPINPDHPILRLPNVVTVPHIGSATAKTRQDMVKVAAENLVKAVTGDKRQNIVKDLAYINPDKV
ncbi:2-hydroxyacid dehydrogenase [Salipaludibacillus sp. HK11]|uniref:2-hydroxyacid dehydrogenase n=1 Tax=Salipaludibacillus sp. HK11 TaxID=3394320 RepID=UPI0039FDC670